LFVHELSFCAFFSFTYFSTGDISLACQFGSHYVAVKLETLTEPVVFKIAVDAVEPKSQKPDGTPSSSSSKSTGEQKASRQRSAPLTAKASN
jgi:hypothetical protein